MFLLVTRIKDKEEYLTDIRFNANSFVIDIPDGAYYRNVFCLVGHNNTRFLQATTNH